MLICSLNLKQRFHICVHSKTVYVWTPLTCYLHPHIKCRCFKRTYTLTFTHTNAIRSGVFNETVWSFISSLLSLQPHSEWYMHLYNRVQFNFHRPGPLCLLRRREGRRGRVHRDGSIVRLPPGSATRTWTQLNRTRSTAATRVPNSPRLKNWGILSIIGLDWYTCTKHSLIRQHAHIQVNLSVCVHACMCVSRRECV